jgi:hypothetical protein
MPILQEDKKVEHESANAERPVCIPTRSVSGNVGRGEPANPDICRMMSKPRHLPDDEQTPTFAG